MICLYVQAPFAVFRTFTAGSFRPTAGFITPSAAYGLLLNIAGIESRRDDGKSPMTLMKQHLPHAKIALGALALPQVHSLYQQAHNYPVGNTGIDHAPLSRGSKYNITPVRREFLSGIRAYICLEDNPELAERVRNGLRGEHNASRYGLPFLGDNNFLIDILREEVDRQPACWYEKVTENDAQRPRSRTTRLTIMIDRKNMANTTSALFSPCPEPQIDIPENAWVSVSS
jgi:CRISPR-associated protein Cas5t